jgi:thiamine biosynthesis lipoprotein
MNRRDFLHPKHLAETAGQVFAAAQELTAPDSPAAPSEVALLRASRKAMATTFELLLPFGTPAASAIASTVFEQIDHLEQQLTVYRETSEVSRLNRLAGQISVPVEPRLFELLALAEEISRETDGAFDVTAGALIKAWGFFRGPRRVPSTEELGSALARVGMRHVWLDAQHSNVRYHRPGLEINLGSIGKGYALDRVAESLRNQWNLRSALLHGGHSSVYAMGSESDDRAGWAVGIQHPWNPARRWALVCLGDRAMATSAATFQHLEHDGRKLGHVLDPRTGWPAEGMASATALAPSAAKADALATAFFILGVERTKAYCESHPGVAALLLPDGANAEPVVIGLSPADYLILDG